MTNGWSQESTLTVQEIFPNNPPDKFKPLKLWAAEIFAKDENIDKRYTLSNDPFANIRKFAVVGRGT